MLFLFLTLRKHFTLPQSIMISYCLLHLYSISGVTHKCFSSYLNNHTQKRLVNGSLSECCTLKCSIPQGTILGPLLFLLYINDLPNCLFHFELIMYVDDFYIPIWLIWTAISTPFSLSWMKTCSTLNAGLSEIN